MCMIDINNMIIETIIIYGGAYTLVDLKNGHKFVLSVKLAITFRN